MKKIIHILLLLLVLGVVFYLSNQNGIKSAKQSNDFLSTVTFNTNNTFVVTKKTIRKFAHMFEFGVVTLFIYLLLNDYIKSKNKVYLLTLGLSILMCVADELHQTFIFGRYGCVYDVGVDAFGVILMLSFIIFINNKKLGSNS